MATKIENYKYCQDALKLKTAIEKSFITLGAYLYQIKQKQLYMPSWTSWNEFCEELKMSDNTINKLIQIYENLVLKYAIPEENIVRAGGWSVIADILPQIHSKKDAQDWLHKAEVLTRSDLRKEITESNTRVSMKDCKHKNTYTITVCRDCGLKIEDHKDHAK